MRTPSADACGDGRPSFTSTNSLLVATDNVSGIRAAASTTVPSAATGCRAKPQPSKRSAIEKWPHHPH